MDKQMKNEMNQTELNQVLRRGKAVAPQSQKRRSPQTANRTVPSRRETEHPQSYNVAVKDGKVVFEKAE